LKIHQFNLQPFPDSLPTPKIEISGAIERREGGIFAIKYQLSGDIAAVEIPAIASHPNRQTELWEATCFEFFLGLKDSSEYWEFNLSLSGDWNIYHLDSYRQGLREETALTYLPFTMQRESDCLSLSLEWDLNAIGVADKILDIAVTTVIKTKNNDIGYWALTHCGTEADFHLRDSFILQI
jgi:hypothetical protein